MTDLSIYTVPMAPPKVKTPEGRAAINLLVDFVMGGDRKAPRLVEVPMTLAARATFNKAFESIWREGGVRMIVGPWATRDLINFHDAAAVWGIEYLRARSQSDLGLPLNGRIFVPATGSTDTDVLCEILVEVAKARATVIFVIDPTERAECLGILAAADRELTSTTGAYAK